MAMASALRQGRYPCPRLSLIFEPSLKSNDSRLEVYDFGFQLQQALFTSDPFVVLRVNGRHFPDLSRRYAENERCGKQKKGPCPQVLHGKPSFSIQNWGK